MRMVLAVLAGMILSGCASSNSTLSGIPTQKAAPIVYIHPMETDSYQRATVGVLPFKVPDNMSREQGLGVAALFKDILLSKQIFRTVKQVDASYSNMDMAIEAGRKAGVDLVMAGKINYAFEGVELGGARVDVSVRLINAGTGNTVWYVEQTMNQPVDYPDLGFVNRLLESFSRPTVRKAAEAPSVPNMLARIAFDMAEVFDGARTVSR
ncbi:MAG: hypothetical protein KKE17_02520 [Proteobacteria bacterium]|nr:hypothetical protein [Pseudomonadota bacterium]MBU1708855.1 hypothetical protein [Pseudomonadota bacterium]